MRRQIGALWVMVICAFCTSGLAKGQSCSLMHGSYCGVVCGLDFCVDPSHSLPAFFDNIAVNADSFDVPDSVCSAPGSVCDDKGYGIDCMGCSQYSITLAYYCEGVKYFISNHRDCCGLPT